jgi:hypothetical protein
VADFNGDGKPDLAVLSSASLSIYLGNGDGTFSAAQVPVGATSPTSLAVADFNGDGVADLVVFSSSANSNAVQVLLGKGDGTFFSPVNSPAPAGPRMFVADFNGDGKADLVLVNEGFGNVFAVLLGNGDGTFQSTGATHLPVNCVASALGDFNGDGKPDVVFAGVLINIALGQGDGTFHLAFVSAAGISGPAGAVVVGDFNGDGKQDLIVLDVFSIPSIRLGNGDGSFQSASSLPGLPAYALAIGDFNGDGKPDVAVVGSTGLVGIATGTGTGTFSPVKTYGPAGSLAIADFNGDGITDFAVVADGSITTYLGGVFPDLSISVWHSGNFAPDSSGGVYTIAIANTGTWATSGTVTVSDSLPPGVSPVSAAGSGWNCNLAPLVCTRSDSLVPGASYPSITVQVKVSPAVSGATTNTVTLVGGGMNLASLTATDTIVFQTGNTVLTVSPSPAVLGQAVTLATTETLGSSGQVTFYDGAQILGVAPVMSGHASMTTRSLGSGNHTLSARFDPDPTSPWAASYSAIVSLAVNAAPAKTFRAPASYAVPPYGALIVNGDFNGDGKADLAVMGSNSLTVMLGNGDGTFRTLPSANVTGASPTDLAVVDLNGDGKQDLVLAGAGVTVLMGNGDGTFRQSATYATNLAATALAIGDFNGDGKADVAFLPAALAGPILELLLGNGDGTFQGPMTVPIPYIGTFGTAIAAGDFRGIGTPDLAIGSDAGVTVLLCNRDGTFQAPRTYPVGRVDGLAIADLNLDGKPDLITSSGLALLGAGDGTFQSATSATLGQFFSLMAVGDFNGDGKLDLIGYSFDVYLGNGDGTFQAAVRPAGPGYFGRVAVGDFNGDGLTDVAILSSVSGFGSRVQIFLGSSSNTPRANLTVWRPSNGSWYVNPASGPAVNKQWGLSGDIPIAGDFDGDGNLDYAVWRPSEGNWYTTLSSGQVLPVTQFGLPGDVPVAGDYDGDGKTDYAVWRPSEGNWYILFSSVSGRFEQQLGLPGDIPVPADFDGLGQTSRAVWRPSTGTWYIYNRDYGQRTITWGLPGDIPVAADFDGDGKADAAVWRPSNGTWYILPSSTGIPYTVQWGLPSDIPVPHDYDGDGKADPAVWRPSNGTWYIIPSASPTAPLQIQWGLPGDVPMFKPVGN